MGGDRGPDVVMQAAIAALRVTPDLALVLVGDEQVLRPLLQAVPRTVRERLGVRHATQRITMEDAPAQALRGKRDSSMHGAVALVCDGTAQACVSAGNTGALMAVARHLLKTLPGIDRPAISTTMPSMVGHTHMLDLGANVDVGPRNLYEFAVMGATLAAAIDGVERPRVGLLNVGAEETKGTTEIKQAARLIAASGLNYVGYVEGDAIYSGEADVVVCDGFAGNIALKSSEGVARMIAHDLKKAFMRNALTRLAGSLVRPVLRPFAAHIDPRRYNGASLLGLNGIVIKSHGGADAVAYANAINTAVEEAKKQVPERIRHQLGSLLAARQAV